MEVSISFKVDLDDSATYDEVQEWAEFYLGKSGFMSNSNPLTDNDLSAKSVHLAFQPK